MIVLFPIMGRALGLSDFGYGLWTGTTINDTSSVVAAGFAYSNMAGNYATIVKLARTLFIIPTVVMFSYIAQRKNQELVFNTKQAQIVEKRGLSIKTIFPYFMLFFILAAITNSIELIPYKIGLAIKNASKFLMIMALGAKGIKTDLKEIKNSGPAPMLHGFIISTIVIIVFLVVQMALGKCK